MIKVIKNPDGYTPNVTETTVQIQNGVAVNVRLVFNAGGTLNIYGVDAAEKGLAGMRVEVTTIDGTRVGTYATDTAGIIRVPGLDAGWYVVTVTKAPDGYTLSEVNQSQNVEITSDGTAQVRFQFGKTYGVQIRTSVSQTGAMVPGVEYKVTKLDGSVVGTYTSDKAGLVYVDLEPGWYVIEQTRLEGVRGRCISALSKGYRQRVGIAQALLGSPRVIILDEPTVGLDPLQIIEIRELIRQLGQTHTVLFSSHILSEVQTICDQILMIAHGRLAAFGAPDELESRLLTPNEITLTAEGTEEQVRALLDGIGAITGRSITAEEGGLVTARLKTGREASLHDVSRALFFAFAGAGVPLLEMALKKANLEDIFIELTEQSAEAPAAAEGEEGEA